MPDQRLDFAVATRVLSPRAFLTSSAEPEAALATVGTQELPDGAVVFVRSVRSWFRLNRAAGGAPDGITIVDAQGPGQWERFDLPDSSWLTQAQWHINATTGSDENDGSAAAPLASWAELSRRWGADPVLPQTTDVFIETDLAEPIVVRGVVYLEEQSFLRIFGAVTATLHSGSITAKTDLDPASNQPSEITDGAVGDWDTAGPGGTSLIGHRIRLTSGANIGAISWLAKRLAATIARTSPFGTQNISGVPPPTPPTLIDPAIADDYVVEQLTTVTGFSLGARRTENNGNTSNHAVLLADLAVLSADHERFVNTGDMRILTVGSRIGALYLVGEESSFSLCAMSCFDVSASVCWALAVLWDNANGVSAVNFRREVILQSQSLVQDLQVQILPRAYLSTPGFGSFDSFSDGLVIWPNAVGRCTGIVWGSGNTSQGIEVVSGGVLTYSSGSKPILTGTAGDTLVGGAATAYAAIPFFNPANGACIVVEA